MRLFRRGLIVPNRHVIPFELLAQDIVVVKVERMKERHLLFAQTNLQLVACLHINKLLHIKVCHRIANFDDFNVNFRVARLHNGAARERVRCNGH